MATEKRNFSGLSFASKKSQASDGHVATTTRLRNFFRINSSGSQPIVSNDGLPTPKSETKGSKGSRFLPVLSRNRSTTTASEGNPLDDSLSPAAHANPYYQHQGPPNLRHHNAGSVPPSPPDTPQSKTNGLENKNNTALTGKEELARKLRRVASAPNTHGLFQGSQTPSDTPERSDAPSNPVLEIPVPTTSVEPPTPIDSKSTDMPVELAKIPTPGQIRQSVVFRRTYSSNSIKVRNVEVGPSSFDKIKLIGKGDVGKVYLVREKKSNRLYAMKGVS